MWPQQPPQQNQGWGAPPPGGPQGYGAPAPYGAPSPYGAPPPQAGGYNPMMASMSQIPGMQSGLMPGVGGPMPGVQNGPPPQQSPYGYAGAASLAHQSMPQMPPPQQQPPMGVPQQGGENLQELFNWFRSVDRDNSGSISANELQMLTFGGHALGLETSAKLVKVFDKNRSGHIDFNEYASLHKFITLMQQAFAQSDRDRSGTLDCQEIHQALQISGFVVGISSVQLFFSKAARGAPSINFPGFLQIGASIALIKSKFEWYDTDKDGYITCNLDTLLGICGDL